MNSDEKREKIEDVLHPAPVRPMLVSRRPGRRGVVALRQVTVSPEPLDPIAIVGCAGILPRCATLAEFWRALDHGEKLIEEIPANRFDVDRYYDPTGRDPQRIRTKWGGFVPAIGAFDPLFFNIAPADARRMDPRQRWLLAMAYHAIEDAGYAPASFKGSKTGVFVAGEENQYAQTLLENGIDLGDGHGASMLANRLSYFFDFRGPSEVVDTMCSGAAVALYRAMQVLRTREVDQAVVGAANFILRPELLVQLSRSGQLSPDNTVNSFGSAAAGSLRAEGVGAVFLKRWSQAVADGDEIYAVLRHAAVNYNGRGGMSMSAPQTEVHADLIISCYREAGVSVRDIGYIEAQGMGTPVADIAEWEACNRALTRLSMERGETLMAGQCRISTLKPMTGHMNAASALGALFKVIHALQTRTIQPILGFTELNPELCDPTQPCQPTVEAEMWNGTSVAGPRLAGLHSYGAGGNNAHLLVEEAIVLAADADSASSGKYALIFSARTPEQLRQVLERMRDFVREHPDVSLHRLAYTLQVGRDALAVRAGFEVATVAELTVKIEAWLAGVMVSGGSDLAALAAWLGGAEIDWMARYKKNFPRRLHLPGYPFAQDCYWWTDIPKKTSEPVNPAPCSESLVGTVLAILKQAVADLLELPAGELVTHRPLIDFGFDSAKFVELARRLSVRLGSEVAPTVFFGHPTLTQLAAHLAVEYPEPFFWAAAPLAGGKAAAVAGTVDLKMPVAKQTVGSEPIAVIGLSGRFSQARSVDEMWTILVEGRTAVTEIPAERFDWHVLVAHLLERAAANPPKWCGSVPGAGEFDPLFFEISPREAELMDPRQRLLLQEAWNALEDAALGEDHIARQTVGMFVGAEEGDYPQQVKERTLTSNHDGILAARLAYFLNLKGPVMALNTACSSSLVAVHQACQSLRSGECDMALAAGVNLLFSPAPYIAMAEAGMLSPEGVCRTFDRRADGLVPGEAVCVVVLKRLTQAITDGDLIRAIIRGSGINYDGRTNGITAPNGVAQADLIRDVLKRHAITADRVQHIVTHGTGTRLGDPIEIDALNTAFRAASLPPASCALTSTKPNFGHTFAASGLVSFIALVESLHHGVIPASLHCTEENEFVAWGQGPFFVNKAARPWPRPGVGERLGAVSAFGMSGTNAHVLVEGFSGTSEEPDTQRRPRLFVLSAKTEQALCERAQALRKWLESDASSKVSFDRICFTLLAGRHHFRYRLAIVARDSAEAARLLAEASFAEEARVARGLVSDQFTPNPVRASALTGLVVRAANGEGLDELAQIFCEGYTFDAVALWGGRALARVPLPTYPFSRKTYWAQRVEYTSSCPPKVHPLVQRRIAADGESAHFESDFTGKEFFLADHVVHGRKTLPGVAYLEMVRAAMVARGTLSPSQLIFRQVTWLRPLEVDDAGRTVRITLTPNGDATRFSVSSRAQGVATKLVPHSEGSVEFAIGKKSVEGQVFAELRERMRGLYFDSFSCRAAFTKMGLDYGPAFQSLTYVRLGNDELLAQLDLPEIRRDTLGNFELHPGLMDGALQAAVGFLLQAGADLLTKVSAPFAVESVVMYRGCSATMWAWLRKTPGSGTEAVRKLDVDLFDSEGNLCVSLRRFSSRVLESSTVQAASSCQPETNLDYLLPFWDSLLGVTSGPAIPGDGDWVEIAGGDVMRFEALRKVWPQARRMEIDAVDSVERLAERLRATGPLEHLCWIAPAGSSVGGDSMVAAQKGGVLAFFRLVKALLATGAERRSITLTILLTNTVSVHPGDSNDPTHSAIHGLIGSLAKEYPQWKIRLLDLPDECVWPVRELVRLPFDATGDALAFRHGEWFKQSLLPARFGVLAEDVPSVFRERGVYVLIGGAGGLGGVLTRYLLETYRAHVYWVGRRPASAEIEEKITHFSGFGPRPVYLQADAADHASLAAAVAAIRKRHAHIHGVVHSALVLADKGLANMTEEAFAAALAAKVDVNVLLAKVFAKTGLDFIVSFSSITAFQKAPGQSNYAAGCTFNDAFAGSLARAAGCVAKVINWSYWGSVGVVSDRAYRDRMERAGIGSIEPAEGMRALETLLRAPVPQAAFLKTLGTTMRAQTVQGPSMEIYPSTAPQCLADAVAKIPPASQRSATVELPEMLRGSRMDALLLQLLRGTLAALNLFDRPASSLPKPYDRWLEESLRLLEIAKLNGSAVARPADAAVVWAEWEQEKAGWSLDAHHRALIALVETCVRALPDILSGRIPATDILFPDSSMVLVEEVYRGNRVADLFNDLLGDAILAFIEERLMRDPGARLRIIEVGAGTGGTSAGLLERLRPFRGAIVEYCYTDISKAFLLHAQEQYVPQHPFVTLRLFDAEKPTSTQQIPTACFDLALATNVLHATKNIRQTLRNVKATLRQGGGLFLNEMLVNPLCLHLTFGLLDGWWRFEDDPLRLPGSPGIASDTWRRILGEEGFAAVAFPAATAHPLGQQIIVAESDGVVWQQPAIVSSVNLTEAAPVPAKQPVSGVMVQEENVRAIVRRCIAEALKIDQAEIRDDRAFSEYGVDSIIAVQLTNRLNALCGTALQTTVLFDYTTIDRLTRHLTETHGALFAAKLGDRSPVALHEPEEANSQPVTAACSVSTPILPPGFYRRALISGPGTVSDLSLVDEKLRAPRGCEVLVMARAFSLNFADLLCVKGLYPNMPPYPFTPGLELAGVVEAVGPDVSTVKVGDEVVCLTPGCHREILLCEERDILPKPAKLSFEEACALPAVAIAMIEAFRKADLQRGESIVIQTAAGGTGLIAVQLAQHAGAEIIATAGSAAKLEYLRKWGVSHLINYCEQDFEQEVRRITGGRGVDVVINTLPGDALQKGLRCLAPGGRYIEIAMTALKSAKAVDLSVLAANQTFYSLDLGRLGIEQPKRLQALRAEMLCLCGQGILRPTISQVFPFADLHEAYRALENRENIGKIVVVVAPRPRSFMEQAFASPVRKPQSLVGAAEVNDGTSDQIAIIGMSGRFAHSETLEDFWAHLACGDNLVGKATRWDLSHLPFGSCVYGSFIESISRFDPHFFSISGTEATYMDPQQRLFLEESWKALEDAGYAGDGTCSKRWGVYVGCDRGNYADLFTGVPPPQSFWGNTGAVIPARIAYFFNLQGPAIAVDTACSSSLVAIHLACQGLRAGDADLALAGGVFLQGTSTFYLAANSAGMLSPTGACHAFDERADGFVPGEGVGAIVLKRLRDAVADGDQIFGVIRSSGVNQDGQTNGITAPSAQSQERLERQVYEQSRIDPGEIGFVEAHGTGTKLGDPIEFTALTKAFRHFTTKRSFCALGSVKTNLGHAATAAGVAGVLKVLLALRHRQIPPSLHFDQANADIALADSPFFVNTTLREWKAEAGRPRLAAISSFGFSGTNAHLVIAEPPVVARRSEPRAVHLVVLSAQSPEQLRRQVENLLSHLRALSDPDLGAIAFTLFAGRRHLGWRLAVVVHDTCELAQAFACWLEAGASTRVIASPRSVAGVRETTSQRVAGNALIETCRGGLRSKELIERLLELAGRFVAGERLDYEQLFAPGTPRVSLPTYPFAPETYWVEKTDSHLLQRRSTAVAKLHPLLHTNVSDVRGVRFESRFDGTEFFLSNHVIRGRKVLPGVASLEMAHAAVVRALPSAEAGAQLRLENWVWLQPLMAGEQGLVVEVLVAKDAAGHWVVEVAETAKDARILHARGKVTFLGNAAPPPIDLGALQVRLRDELSVQECYEHFRAIGQVYGEAHRSLRKIQRGTGEVLAKLELPKSLVATRDEFDMHPSLLDGALQATWALGGITSASQVFMPFSIEAVEVVFGESPIEWAWVREVESIRGGTVRKLDINLCDGSGRVGVRLCGLVSRPRPVAGESESQRLEKTAPVRMMTSLSTHNYWLDEHRVDGVATLPAVAYLEMARTAVVRAGQTAGAIRQVVWSAPLQVPDQPVTAIILFSAADHTVQIETDSASGKCRHFQATISVDRPADVAAISIAPIQAYCSQVVTREEVVRRFATQHFSGAGRKSRLRTLTGFQYSSTEAFATLEQASGLDGEFDVGLLDGVLTAVHLHHALAAAETATLVPFALSEMIIYGALPAQAVVHLRRVAGEVLTYEMDVADVTGRVAIAFRGYVMRIWAPPRIQETTLLYAVPHWETIAAPVPPVSTDDAVFVLRSENKSLVSLLRLCWPGVDLVELDETQPTELLLTVFKRVQGWLESKPTLLKPWLFLVAESEGREIEAALSGLVRTLRLEEAKFSGKVVRYSGIITPDQLAERLAGEIASGDGSLEVRLEQDARWVKQWRETELSAPTVGSIGLQAGEVVLITGGLGGLGRIFARHFATTYGARVVLSGRTLAEVPADLRTVGEIYCFPGDISDSGGAESLVMRIEREIGPLRAVVHAAGILRDSYARHKTEDDFRTVLRPKIAGVLALEWATRSCNLRFFVLCSSLAGAMGGPGQTDYAAANAFLDGFAAAREVRVQAGLVRGVTRSINWALWREGGMRMTEEAVRTMERTTGVSAMATAVGLQAFEAVLAGSAAQVLVATGNLTQMRARLLGVSAAIVQPKPEVVRGAGVENVQRELALAICQLQKVPEEKIDPTAELSVYGFDSISFTSFVNQLNIAYGIELMPTVFFEHSTLESLAVHLAERYPEKFGKLPAVASNAEAQYEIQEPVLARSELTKQQLRAEELMFTNSPEPIAIVGMSGCFPGSVDLPDFWRHLEAGDDLITEVPADRWDWRERFGDPHAGGGKMRAKWGGFVDGIEDFDPGFFGISRREAEAMDPQQRLLMEYTWLAIEDAGYAPAELAGTDTALFIGTGSSGRAFELGRKELDVYGPTGLVPSVGPSRVSFLLDLHGPSEPVETACSSSLVAIHRAVACLRAGECTQAIVGGVNTLLVPEIQASLDKAGMLSPDGRCRTFAKNANGYVRGEGVGMLFLKKLSAAESNGDHIYGLIRGTAENHGGRATSLTAPNPVAQSALLKKAYTAAGVDPRTVTYIEAHGTGTELGDPIEVGGLKTAFRELEESFGDSEGVALPREEFCGLGSVKTNIGHLELAAGVAGVIKVLLQMKHRRLVKNLHTGEMNPYLEIAGSPFYLIQESREWVSPRDRTGCELPLRAGVSSFGFGGVNAHVILEKYQPELAVQPAPTGPVVIVLSAKSEDRLRIMAANLVQFVTEAEKQGSQALLADVAYTLQVGRAVWEERLAFVATSLADTREKLQAFLTGSGFVGDLQRSSVRKKLDDGLALFAGDEELQEAVGKWIERKKYRRLAEAWVKGLPVTWKKLYIGQNRRRVSLPGYPFARESFSTQKATNPNTAGVPRFLKKIWVDAPRGQSLLHVGKVAVLAREASLDLARILVAALPDAEIVDPNTPLERDSAAWTAYTGLIDLLGCDPGADELNGLVWVQRMIELGSRDGLRLLGVTCGLESHQNIPSRWSDGGAGRAALYRLLSSEYTYVMSRHIDGDPVGNNAEFATQIVAEFFDNGPELEICYRRANRFRSCLTEVVLPAAKQSPFVFPAGKAIWISGGTRGLGALCARHVVEKYGVRRLVLSGRETLPPREHWPEVEKTGGELAKKISALRTLEALGAEVKVVTMPLGGVASVPEVVGQVAAEFGPIGGLFHCAGVFDQENPAFIRKTNAAMRRVLEPKQAGTRHLLAALHSKSLDVCVLFSSVSSAVPALGAGCADYAMANACLDALAEAQPGGTRIVSVQWPAWSESGQGGLPGAAYREAGFLSLSDHAGLGLLDQVLSSRPGPVVLAAQVNEAKWNPGQLFDRKSLIAVPRASARKIRPAPSSIRDVSGSIGLWLAELFAAELHTTSAQLDEKIPFADYGVDSIMLAQVARRIGKAALKPLDPSLLYENDTIAALARALEVAQVLDLSKIGIAEKIAPIDAGSSVIPATSWPAKPMEFAVVGMACRFPGSENLDAYWRLLAEERSAIAPVPVGRRSEGCEGYAALIPPLTAFDSGYFLIPPEDARAMDPQALLLLEESLNLLAHAGYTSKEMRGSATGVYVGGRSLHQPAAEDLRGTRNAILATGHNYLAANLSQFYDLRGPSMVIDTACSSALVGLHLATQALAAGEIGAAIVGGVSLLNGGQGLQMFEQRKLLSRSAEFHVFDRRASGIVLGEGCGMVLVKTLEQAERDGDRIYTVVKGIAINNDGRTAGPATPNVKAQMGVMQTALTRSGLAAAAIKYVEANGSGSEVTDLLELKAVQSVYRPVGGAPCDLGSAKPNIGHTLCAEGIAGFIKLALMLSRGSMVPFLSGQEPMTHFNFERSPFVFRRETTAWVDKERTAALNCFADGGTNAHVIIGAAAAGREAGRASLLPPALRRTLLRSPELIEPAVSAICPVILSGSSEHVAVERKGHYVARGPCSRWKREPRRNA